MFDTNVFNRIAKSSIDVDSLPGNCQYFVTSLQHAEILKTKDLQMRGRLLSAFCKIVWETGTKETEIKSTPWGVPWGSPWNKGGGPFKQIKQRLDRHPKSRSKRGNKFDALIIEVCAEENITLVSGDGPVRDVAPEFGVEQISFDEFLEIGGQT